MTGWIVLALAVAWTTGVPRAVTAAEAGCPGYFLLAGVCALLPDALEAFARLWPRAGRLHVRPGNAPREDAAAIAAALAELGRRALLAETRSATLQIESPLPADARRPTRIRIDPAGHALIVRVGEERLSQPLPGVITTRGLREVQVTAPDGIRLQLRAARHGQLRLDVPAYLCPASHSLLPVVVVGGLTALLAGGPAATVAIGSILLHLMVDHFGPHGVPWLWPEPHPEQDGLSRWRSPSPSLACFAIWGAALLSLWNLLRLSPRDPRLLDPLRLLLYGLLAPYGVLRGLSALLRRWHRPCATRTGQSACHRALRSQTRLPLLPRFKKRTPRRG